MELSLLIDNHLVTWNGSATFNICWIGGLGQGPDVHCFTNYNVNKTTPIETIHKIMQQGYEDWNYGY
jgi:hypothetical protein